MGNAQSRRAFEDKQQLLDRINDLNSLVKNLQKDLDAHRAKLEEAKMSVEKNKNELNKEIKNSAEKSSAEKKEFSEELSRQKSSFEQEKTEFNRELANQKERFEQEKKELFRELANQKERFELQKKELCQELNNQKEHFEQKRNELWKAQQTQKAILDGFAKDIQKWEKAYVTFNAFTPLKVDLEVLRKSLENDKEGVSTIITKKLEGTKKEWDKDVLQMMEKYQETRGFMMELITLNLAHEKELNNLNKRLSRLEGRSFPISEEILPLPSLPSIPSMQSTASASKTSKTELRKRGENDGEDPEDYRLRFTKISSIMKKMNDELEKRSDGKE